MTISVGSAKIFIIALIIAVFQSCRDNPSGEQHKYTNALANETSPYLLQHAHNPVDWRPWSESVWDDASKQDKLVVISIGYSSCHWCHVMEEETFEDEEVAELMNEKYISVKVDREERPDVDQVYMTALQLLTGSGGWPLNIIATPEGKPLYGGTYHTKSEWMKVLKELDSLYQEDPLRAAEFAERVAQGVRSVNQLEDNPNEDEFDSQAIQSALTSWKDLWDEKHGGLNGEQKFMLPENMRFLMHYATQTGDTETLEYVKLTLDKMAFGGIYDHVGGGFFRYSTDPYWNIPHFEKMLYDNAQALSLYSEAFKVFKDTAYLELIDETTAFLESDLSNGEGAYYAALDADSEGKEGAYYVWQMDEVEQILGDEFHRFTMYFPFNHNNVVEEKEFVLNPLGSPRQYRDSSKTKPYFLEKLPIWKEKLLKARSKREKPGVDDKILTSWNALMITGFADAYESTGNQEYLEKAEAIFSFLEEHSFNGPELGHSYKKNSRFIPGFLEDYAYLTNASLKLYKTTGKETYLKFAAKLHQKSVDKFKMNDGVLYRYKEDDELIATIIKTDDAVLPSPNAVMADNYFTLGHIEYSRDFLDKSQTMLNLLWPRFKDSPHNYARWGQLYLQHTYPYFEIAIVGEEASKLNEELSQFYLPNALVVFTDSESESPLFKSRYVGGETFVYVCREHTCKLPVQTIEETFQQMASW